MATSLLDALQDVAVYVGRVVLARVVGGQSTGVNAPAARKLREDLFAQFPFTPEAAGWLRENAGIAVKDFTSQRGGGYWYADQRLVLLFTAQMEAALHEHAHAWWEFHGHRLPAADELIDAVIRLSQEPDPAYAATQKLAYDYVHGIPAQHWAGMLVDRNDHEMFAGLASGTMGDMSKLPPYVRSFYHGLFVEPGDARRTLRGEQSAPRHDGG
jgi:hypothetical protein